MGFCQLPLEYPSHRILSKGLYLVSNRRYILKNGRYIAKSADISKVAVDISVDFLFYFFNEHYL
ncbi:hypothetical protein SAMN04488574_10983 [Bacillus sp. 71mf]|nr:hypothetical protein SAMN04488574_10983 [Bacillus sp. 71mf]SFS54433.1 hypothetical protein SAMN04488145_1011143 [Bacillus sp. 103mf]